MSETTTDGGFAEPVDTTVAPPVMEPAETETTQTEPADHPDAAVEPEGEKKPEATEEPAPKRRPWWENAIAEARAAERAAKRELAETLARVPKATPAPTAPPADAVPVAEVEKRAREMADEGRFIETCNEIAGLGEAKYPDFDDAVKNFAMLGEMPKPFLEGITALGKDDGARVYYELGKNPDEAARIFKLPPVRMAVELAKLSAVQPKVAAVSKAPAPIEPITSRVVRADAEPDAAKEPAEWTRWFNEQRRKR